VTAIAPWKLASVPAKPRKPSVMLFVFGNGPLRDDVEMSLSRFGAPSAAAVESCAVQTVTRATDPRWFDAWRSGSLRTIAEQDLGNAIAALDASDHVHVIACEPAVVADLTYLLGVWALVRYSIARGGTIVLDAHAMTYRPADKVQPAGEGLDVRREVRVIFETDSTRSDRAHALHTRGMRKFGAPDLVALCSDSDVPLVGEAITELADQVARGTDLASPRHALEIAAGVRWVAVADEHGLAELLQLNNDARILVDEMGHDLVGVVGRVQRN
jgi:hypothetical protein